jgi:hypothetical protein
MTYTGDEAGRTPGAIDDAIRAYLGGAQQSGAQSDYLFGGPQYGRAADYYGQGQGEPGGGPPPADDGGGAGRPRGLSRPMSAPGGGGRDPGADPNGPPEGGPGAGAGTTGPGDPGTGAPGYGDGGTGDPNGDDGGDGGWTGGTRPPLTGPPGGHSTPTGGLAGYYQGQLDNPWQTGPNGNAETDVLGSYDWMASGERNGDEKDVYGRMGNYGTEGTPDGSGRTLEGLSSDVNRGLMKGEFNAPESEANDTYAGLAEGPNARENALYGKSGDFGLQTGNEAGLYGDTDQFGKTMGADQGDASSFYRNRLQHGGYDDATKTAITGEAMKAARSPFERARDRVVRGAAARGNPASTMGAEIAMARDEGDALSSAARQNQIALAQEKIRQEEGGATGLMGSQSMTNAQKEYALSQKRGLNADLADKARSALTMQAGQNAQAASQKIAGAQGLQSGGKALTEKALAGSAANTALANEMAARRKAGIEMQAGQNTQQRGLALAGTQGKQGMFQDMAARKAAAAGGQSHLYDTSVQQGAADLAGAVNAGGKTREDYTESGGTTGSGGVSI